MNTLMPPPPDKLAAAPQDRTRRHYDFADAEAIVRRLERDYGARMQYVSCPIRRGMYHIEFAVPLNETQQAILVRYVDGYNPSDLAVYFPGLTPVAIGQQMTRLHKEVGLLSRHHLISLAVYFGIVTPTMLTESGEYA